MRSSIFKLIGLFGSSAAETIHPEKPWDTAYCLESFNVLPALTITPSDDCENCFLAHFYDENIIVTPPENFFRDEHFHLSVFLSEEVYVKRPQGLATGNVIANTWSEQNYPQFIGYMQVTHQWMQTSPKVEGPLDAKIWFQPKEPGQTIEFIHADLCMTPPWESSTWHSTTTDSSTTTTKKITTPAIKC